MLGRSSFYTVPMRTRQVITLPTLVTSSSPASAAGRPLILEKAKLKMCNPPKIGVKLDGNASAFLLNAPVPRILASPTSAILYFHVR